MDQRKFQDEMAKFIDGLCERRALGPLRDRLPHYPMPNGFSDEWAALAQALKTVRVQHRDALPQVDLDRLVALQHAAESALEGGT
jgi:hypothetical protein